MMCMQVEVSLSLPAAHACVDTWRFVCGGATSLDSCCWQAHADPGVWQGCLGALVLLAMQPFARPWDVALTVIWVASCGVDSACS
jgi:hypothetical protein